MKTIFTPVALFLVLVTAGCWLSDLLNPAGGTINVSGQPFDFVILQLVSGGWATLTGKYNPGLFFNIHNWGCATSRAFLRSGFHRAETGHHSGQMPTVVVGSLARSNFDRSVNPASF
jgi:hypothetical protein